MEGEPSWTKQISSEQVCTFFYAFAIIHITIATIAFIVAILIFLKSKSSFIVILPNVIGLIISGAISFTTALFHYLICQRALLKKE